MYKRQAIGWLGDSKISKHNVPSRTCVTCGTKKPKTALLRIGLKENGVVEIDDSLNLAGRGAYICRSNSCLSRSISKAQLEYALRCRLGSEDWNTFKTAIENLTL